MATHDYSLANQSGSSFRTDLNNVLAAIVSNNSASSEPSTKYAYQYWADTSGGYLKIRNAANNAWIQLFKLDGTLSDIPVEGTVIKSTGESGGTKFLREDGDNSCSWQSISQTALTGSTNNTVCTVTGANAISGEANLTYDGDILSVGTGSGGAIVKVSGAEGGNAELWLQADEGDDDADDWLLYNNASDNKLKFANKTSGSYVDKLAIDTDGDVGIGTTSPSVKLHVNGGDGLLVERSSGSSVAGFKQTGSSAMNIYFQNSGSTNHPSIGSSNQDLTIGTNNNERLRVLSAGGLTFNGDTAAANALHDYEQGTFTASVGTNGSAPTISGTNSFTGYYTKIGNVVHVNCYISGVNITSSGSNNAKISGLPFNCRDRYTAITITHNTLTASTCDGGYIQPNSAFFYPIQEGSTSGSALATGNPLYMMFAGTYLTDS